MAADWVVLGRGVGGQRGVGWSGGVGEGVGRGAQVAGVGQGYVYSNHRWDVGGWIKNGSMMSE